METEKIKLFLPPNIKLSNYQNKYLNLCPETKLAGWHLREIRSNKICQIRANLKKESEHFLLLLL
jgi:hypothetical protein